MLIAVTRFATGSPYARVPTQPLARGVSVTRLTHDNATRFHGGIEQWILSLFVSGLFLVTSNFAFRVWVSCGSDVAYLVRGFLRAGGGY